MFSSKTNASSCIKTLATCTREQSPLDCCTCPAPLPWSCHSPTEQRNELFLVTKPNDSHGTAQQSLPAFPCTLLTGTSVASNSDPYCSRAQTEILQRNSFPSQTCQVCEGKPSAWFSSSNLPSQTANTPLKPSTLLLPPATSRNYTGCQDSQLPPYFILRFYLLYNEQVLPSTSNFLYIKRKGGDLCVFLCCLYYVCSEIPGQYVLINPF